MSTPTRLSALRMIDPVAWKREIATAMQRASSHVPKAAEILNVSEASLYRALRDPMLADLPRAPSGVRRTG